MNSLFREGSIGEILLKSQIITERDIQTALEEQIKFGLRFGETLVKLGIVRQEDIDWALSHQLDIPYVRINKETVDPAVFRLVPAALARRHDFIPIVQIGNELRIAIADPLNREAVAAVEKVSGCSVAISMGLLREIHEMQDFFYGAAEEVDSLGFSSNCFSEEILERVNKDLGGTALLQMLLNFILHEDLSSISCKPLKENVKVSGKKGVSSVELGVLSISHYASFLATAKDLAGVDGGAEAFSCGTIRLEVETEHVLFQAFLMRTGTLEYLTLKPLFTTPFPESLAALATSAGNSEVLRRLVALPDGLVLFASDHAEERVRLMGACLQEYGESGKDLLLLGNGFLSYADVMPVLPIARHDPELSRWIRAALDHDPAVVAVEELTDYGAFTAAFEAVLSGKLLFGGMAAAGIRSLLKQCIYLRDRLPMISSYLRGVVACKGVRLLCPVCKEKEASPPSLPVFGEESPGIIFRAKGCPACRYTGHSGKRILVEAAFFEQEYAEDFERMVTAGEMMAYLRQKGVCSMVGSARGLLQAGDIAAAEYMSVTLDNGAEPWPE